jgi:hypothetical protein
MGRDLEAALLAMPETSVSAAGTQPMTARPLPPTRVAAADAAPTVLMDPAQAQPVPSRRLTRITPLLAAAGLVAILTAAGAAFTMNRDKSDALPEPAASFPGTPDPTALASASAALADSGGTGTASLPDDTTLLRRPAVTAPASNAEPPGTRRSGATRDGEVRPAAIREQIRAARTAVETNMQADAADVPELRRVVTMLTRTLPDVQTFADSVEVRYLRAQALGLIGETDRSCRELDALLALDLARQLRTEIDALRASACQ